MRAAEELFRRQMAAFLAQDVAAVLACFSPQCAIVDMSQPDVRHVGHTGLRSFVESYFAQWSIEVFDIVGLVADDVRVAGELVITLLPKDGSLGQVRVRSCIVDTVHEGLIATEHVYRHTEPL